MTGESFRVPGSLYVEPFTKQLGVLHVGTDVGWIAPRGLRRWSQEISVVLKADVPEAVCHELGVILPDAQPVASKLPNVRLAARASKLVEVESSLVEKLLARRVRVHTVGSEGVTGGFYYFAKGGKEKPVRMQGNIFEMLALALAKSPDNAMLEECLDGLIDRLLTELSGQVLSEAQVELAGALSSLGSLRETPLRNCRRSRASSYSRSAAPAHTKVAHARFSRLCAARRAPGRKRWSFRCSVSHSVGSSRSSRSFAPMGSSGRGGSIRCVSGGAGS